MEHLNPPPIRRLPRDNPPAAPRGPGPPGSLDERRRPGGARSIRRRPQPTDRGSPVLDPPDGDRQRLGRLQLQAGGEIGLAAGPPGRGPGDDRPLRLRQDDAPALAQPAHRADPDRDPDRRDQARRDRHQGDRADLAAAAGDDGLPAAEPVPDERLRQHRLRHPRAGVAAPAQKDARTAGPQRARSKRGCSRRSKTTSPTRR